MGRDGYWSEVMRPCQIAAALLTLVIVWSARGENVWILEGGGGTSLPECRVIIWRPGAVVHNRSAASLTIHPLHVSNGGSPAPPQIFPASASAVLRGGTADAAAWISQIDVPAGTAIEGRMELYNDSCHPPAVPPTLVPASKVSMPVFRRLVPAGEEQTHYGTDLGGAETRENVGIYNAGESAATAIITVVQPFCGTTLTQTAVVPADTFVQVTIQRITPCIQGSLQHASTYTTVRVDQPSLTLVSTLVNGDTPNVSMTVTASN
jgi:hypothetical protein